MASEKKKRKLKNSYCVPSALKNKLPHRCKRLLFYTSSQRQQEKQEIKESTTGRQKANSVQVRYDKT